MKKEEYERLKNLALSKLEHTHLGFPEDIYEKNIEELIQINEIYQAELEAQNDELQTNVFNLEEAQNELEILFTHAPIPYMLMTSKFNIIRANEEALKMFGSQTFFSKNVPFYTHLHKGYITTFLDWIHNEEREHLPLEMLLNTKQGLRYCALHYHKWSIHESDTFLLSIIDVHAQKEENDRFKALFENTQQGIVYLAANNTIVDLNATASEIIGDSKENCILKKHADFNWRFVDSDEKSISIDDLPFSKALQTKEPQEPSVYAIYRPKSQTKIWLRMEAMPHFIPQNKELKGVFCIFTDVSKEYSLNQELNQQLENFKTLGNNIPDVIMRVDHNQNILFLNKKGSDFFQIGTDKTENVILCDLAIFKTKQAENICTIFKDLEKLNDPITYSLNYKTDKKNKNYFIRVIPEQTNDSKKIFLIIIEDITERVESEDMFNQLFYNASDAIILTDHHTGKIISINSKAQKLLDLDDKNLEQYSSDTIFEAFKSKDDYVNHIDSLDKFGIDSYEATRTLFNNEKLYLKIYCTLIEIGEETYHQSIVHDLTEHKILELQLRQTSKVFEHTTEGILITDLKGSIISVNDAFSKMTGYKSAEVIGKNPSILQSGRHDKSFYDKIWNDIKNQGVWKGEIWNKKKNGTIYPEWLAISPIYDDNEKVIQYVAIFSDFSEIKKNQNKLEELANYDPLTRLPNRLLLHEQMKQMVKLSKRNKNQFAVLFIDLDRFKQINDTHGHGTGDEVLKMTARRIQSVLRETDIVARLGGDEFVVVITDIQNIENAHMISQNILDKLQEKFTVYDSEHYISCSIGVSIYPNDTVNDDIDILLKNADIAMYESKTAGKNSYHMFSSRMAETVKTLSALHNDLNKALNNNEFYLVYQPQYDVVKDELLGFEALIRWKHATRGEVGPDNFIPYTEESKLIIPIGKWILEQVLVDNQEIKKVLKSDFTIAVNVSHVQMNQDFVNTLELLVKQHKDFAKVIKIEITETSVMKNIKNTQSIIGQIKAMGFKISLDDFGTGYSALNAIKTLRVDEIKIDRSFIKDVPGDKDDEELVSVIIAMAKVMKKSVVAEGVETTDTRDFLIEKKCPIIQGYLIGKPLPLDKTLEYIKKIKGTVQKSVLAPSSS
ncbi:PAS domain S-box-containing protein/diguanylate cyclase (GGDEF) domain-containing protein [Epsilonproteobacteria bacterium SCGC AD-311-C15]|jgi:diguanylate cyclase (GGDEF)-like protein/PAS domain S-box-containing protein|nr:PAS domain S-box-containing protein/diguanylate cyclase (GGDEF) domain-containing protein [Epsilonproteobacteria bacterium SCGC AD-311-C15]